MLALRSPPLPTAAVVLPTASGSLLTSPSTLGAHRDLPNPHARARTRARQKEKEEEEARDGRNADQREGEERSNEDWRSQEARAPIGLGMLATERVKPNISRRHSPLSVTAQLAIQPEPEREDNHQEDQKDQQRIGEMEEQLVEQQEEQQRAAMSKLQPSLQLEEQASNQQHEGQGQQPARQFEQQPKNNPDPLNEKHTLPAVSLDLTNKETVPSWVNKSSNARVPMGERDQAKWHDSTSEALEPMQHPRGAGAQRQRWRRAVMRAAQHVQPLGHSHLLQPTAVEDEALAVQSSARRSTPFACVGEALDGLRRLFRPMDPCKPSDDLTPAFTGVATMDLRTLLLRDLSTCDIWHYTGSSTAGSSSRNSAISRSMLEHSDCDLHSICSDHSSYSGADSLSSDDPYHPRHVASLRNLIACAEDSD